MPQSHAKILIHLIYSTKNRTPCLKPEIRPRLWKYKCGILDHLKCPVIAIGGEIDHAHILFSLARTVPIATVVEEVKTSATKWLKKEFDGYHNFHWQHGYGAFSVSPSKTPQVEKYIRSQEEYHKTHSYQEEYREFLRMHGVEWDERYVWD